MLTRRATREAGSQVGTIATPPSPHPDFQTAPERPPPSPTGRRGPPADRRPVGLAFLDCRRLVPESLRPSVRDLSREEVPEEILLRLVVASEDASGGILPDTAGHEGDYGPLAVGHHQARRCEEPLRPGPAFLVRPAEVELRDLLLLVWRDDRDHQCLATWAADLRWQLPHGRAP